MELKYSVKVPKATLCFLTILMLVWWLWGDYSPATIPHHLVVPMNIAPDNIDPQNTGEVNSNISIPGNETLNKSAIEIQQNFSPRATESKSNSAADKAVAA